MTKGMFLGAILCLSFLTGCDSLYSKVKGPVKGGIKINDNWKSFSTGKPSWTGSNAYSLMRGGTIEDIKGFYSEITSAAFMPERISFGFNGRKYYLCRDTGIFSTGKELSIIEKSSENELVLKNPRAIADACVFELISSDGLHFLVVFTQLLPTSRNCKLWILDESFNVVYEEVLSDVRNPEIIKIIPCGFVVKTGCSSYRVYGKEAGL